VAVGAGRVVGPAGRAAWLVPVLSLISVQPLDETGNPTPACSLKVHVMLVVVALTATVPVPVLVTASAGHMTWLSWAAGRPGWRPAWCWSATSAAA
jgi:hypothetical protein